MVESLHLRHYQEGDEEQILELFSLSYGGRQLPLEFWKWRFKDHPSGPGIIELSWELSREHDLLTAHYAVSSTHLRIQGQDRLTGLSGTTMTHPAHRGKRIFPSLAKAAYERMKETGMAAVWGFPNSLSHRGFICDLGWSDIYEIPTFRLHLDSLKTELTASSAICELLDSDERFDQLWLRVQDDYGILTRRDQAYVRWRYFSHPTEKYRLFAHLDQGKIQGYAVFKIYQKELQVVDLLIRKNEVEVGKSLMTAIIAEACKEQRKSVALWLNGTHPLHPVLEKMGFVPEGPVTYFGGLAMDGKLSSSLYNHRQWHFTMSDSDVY